MMGNKIIRENMVRNKIGEDELARNKRMGDKIMGDKVLQPMRWRKVKRDELVKERRWETI